MMLSRTQILRLIPHQGAMCLLDGVQRWDERSIVCAATNHRDVSHPLRDGGTLRSVCGIEYAAQAIAVHGGLLAGAGLTPTPVGFLAAVRDLVLRVDRLDDISGPLSIRAEALMAQGNGRMYRFAVSAGGQELLSGRVSVFVSRTDADIPSASPSRDNGPTCTS